MRGLAPLGLRNQDDQEVIASTQSCTKALPDTPCSRTVLAHQGDHILPAEYLKIDLQEFAPVNARSDARKGTRPSRVEKNYKIEIRSAQAHPTMTRRPWSNPPAAQWPLTPSQRQPDTDRPTSLRFHAES